MLKGTPGCSLLSYPGAKIISYFIFIGWPSIKLIDKVKQKPVCLVAKQKGWRYAFNQAEKTLLLDTVPIQNNCRRRVLKVMKGFNEDYKWKLKSFHIKTLMLHQFQSESPDIWTDKNFLLCLKWSMNRLFGFLHDRKLPHFFLPRVNLFENLELMEINRITEFITRFQKDTVTVLKEVNGIQERR